MFDDFQKLIETEQKYVFDKYKIEIPTRIPEQELWEGIELLLGT
jgi:hypothetical protein